MKIKIGGKELDLTQLSKLERRNLETFILNVAKQQHRALTVAEDAIIRWFPGNNIDAVKDMVAEYDAQTEMNKTEKTTGIAGAAIAPLIEILMNYDKLNFNTEEKELINMFCQKFLGQNELNFATYQQAVAESAYYPERLKPIGRLFTMVALGSKSGEVLSVMKHMLAKDNAEFTEQDKEVVKERLSTVLWYLSEVAANFDITFQEIAQYSINTISKPTDTK